MPEGVGLNGMNHRNFYHHKLFFPPLLGPNLYAVSPKNMGKSPSNLTVPLHVQNELLSQYADLLRVIDDQECRLDEYAKAPPSVPITLYNALVAESKKIQRESAEKEQHLQILRSGRCRCLPACAIFDCIF